MVHVARSWPVVFSSVFLSHIFLTKSGPHYKIRTPLQNQDQEPFFKSQQQDQTSPN